MPITENQDTEGSLDPPSCVLKEQITAKRGGSSSAPSRGANHESRTYLAIGKDFLQLC